MSPIFIAFLSATLTPVLMALWGKMSPVRELSGWEPTFDTLKRRNNIIDGVACVLCLIGIGVPLPLMQYIPESTHMWAVGLGFGLMVLLPVMFVTLVTLPFGIGRFLEFWRFYELKYKIGIRGIIVLYIPLMILGAMSVYEISKSI